MLLEKKDILPSKKISNDPFGLVDANPNVYGEIKTAHFLASFSENARLDNLLYMNTYLNESISRSKPKLNTATLSHNYTNAGMAYECRPLSHLQNAYS
jgi:hypothetical protein